MSDTNNCMSETEARAYMAAEAARYGGNWAWQWMAFLDKHPIWMPLSLFGSFAIFATFQPLSQACLFAMGVMFSLRVMPNISAEGPPKWREGKVVQAVCLADVLWPPSPPPRRRLSKPSPLRWKKARVRVEPPVLTLRRDQLMRGRDVLCILDWSLSPTGEWTARVV